MTSSEEDTEESAEDAQFPESPRQVTDRVVKAASKEAKAADLRARLEADKAKAKGQRKPAELAGPPKVKAAEPPKKKATEPPSPEPRTPSLDASRPVKEKNPRRRGGHGKAACPHCWRRPEGGEHGMLSHQAGLYCTTWRLYNAGGRKDWSAARRRAEEEIERAGKEPPPEAFGPDKSGTAVKEEDPEPAGSKAPATASPDAAEKKKKDKKKDKKKKPRTPAPRRRKSGAGAVAAARAGAVMGASGGGGEARSFGVCSRPLAGSFAPGDGARFASLGGALRRCGALRQPRLRSN